MGRLPWLTLLIVASLLLGACSGGGGAPSTASAPATNAAPTSASSDAPTAPSSTPDGPANPMPPAASIAPADPAVASPAAPTAPPAPAEVWQTASLRDVRTGETFSIASLAGRLVVIEPMAMWCTNCRAQQNAAGEALAQVNDPNVVYISLDVEPAENEGELARYADRLGFGWRFVVASREVTRSLANAFGDTVLAPPAVPSIIVNPDGRVESSFGFRSAADLATELTARLP